MSTLSVSTITDASGGNTATINGQTPTVSNMAGRNRIINGDMRIDQRNAGGSGTASTYTVDRWQFYAGASTKGTWQQNAGSVTPPVGFTNYLGFTSNSAYSIGSGDYFSFGQWIEGYNIADLGWGTANAKTVTLSFQVYSSLTGTFGGALRGASNTRSYPFTYTVSSANTWTTVSVTIAGPTTGTWLTTNGVGVAVIFSLGVGSAFTGTAGTWASANYINATGATSVVGTSGATFYITGVQLEAGSVATPFENVDYGEMLRRCQRYYYANVGGGGSVSSGLPSSGTDIYRNAALFFPVPMRATPTISVVWSTGSGQGNQFIGVQSFQTYTNVSSTSALAVLRSFTATSEL